MTLNIYIYASQNSIISVVEHSILSLSCILFLHALWMAPSAISVNTQSQNISLTWSLLPIASISCLNKWNHHLMNLSSWRILKNLLCFTEDGRLFKPLMPSVLASSQTSISPQYPTWSTTFTFLTVSEDPNALLIWYIPILSGPKTTIQKLTCIQLGNTFFTNNKLFDMTILLQKRYIDQMSQ